MSVLPDKEYDEIESYNPFIQGWSETDGFLYYTVEHPVDFVLTTTGTSLQKRSKISGRILQHVFSKENWTKKAALEKLVELAEKVFKGSEYSGHYGHVGRPGVVGGSLPSNRAVWSIREGNTPHKFSLDKWWQDQDSITVFHGTSVENLSRMTEEGLKPSTAGHTENYIYLTTSPQQAWLYSAMGGEVASGGYARLEPKERVVLALKLSPKGIEGTSHPLRHREAWDRLVSYAKTDPGIMEQGLELRTKLSINPDSIVDLFRPLMSTKQADILLGVATKLRLEEMEPVKLGELEEADLIEDHERLHEYYKEWVEGEHRNQEGGDWSFADLLNAHSFVVEELEKRGKKCDYDDELAEVVEKSLVELCKEATEDFVWKGWDEPVKIIIKGGEGSGWFAPPKGTHGAGGQGGGSGKGEVMLVEGVGWDSLPLTYQGELQEVIQIIPEDHIDGIAGFNMDGNDETIRELRAGLYCGEYNYKTRVVSLVPGLAGGATLMHEVGHHMESVVFTGRQQALNVLQGSYNKVGRIPSPKEVGLRSYSKSHMDEFWADSYMLWGMARSGNVKAKGYISAYRKEFPAMATILDDVWEG